MPVAHQRGTPVVYVAASARELPTEVRDWLGKAEIRAVASPNIYDLLAELARGKRYAVIVVNITSVDWNEMEFFDHAARLGCNADICVAGLPQHRAKLEAACRRGARLFDPAALAEDAELHSEILGAETDATDEVPACRSTAAVAGEAVRKTEPGADLALDDAPGAVEPIPASWPRFRLAEAFETESPEVEQPESEADEEPLSADEPESPDAACAVCGPDVSSIEAAPTPSEREFGDARGSAIPPADIADERMPREPVGFDAIGGSAKANASNKKDALKTDVFRRTDAFDSADVFDAPDAIENADALDESAAPAGTEVSAELEEFGAPSAPDEAEPPRPPVRLAADAVLEQPSDLDEESDTPIVFPWTANANRPRRTPPSHAVEPDVAPPAQAVGGGLSDSPFRSVRLTPEEIAALMGQPPRRQAPEAQS